MKGKRSPLPCVYNKGKACWVGTLLSLSHQPHLSVPSHWPATCLHSSQLLPVHVLALLLQLAEHGVSRPLTEELRSQVIIYLLPEKAQACCHPASNALLIPTAGQQDLYRDLMFVTHSWSHQTASLPVMYKQVPSTTHGKSASSPLSQDRKSEVFSDQSMLDPIETRAQRLCMSGVDHSPIPGHKPLQKPMGLFPSVKWVWKSTQAFLLSHRGHGLKLM